MIFVRERMNPSAGRRSCISCPIVFGLLWLCFSFLISSAGESARSPVTVFTNAQQILELGIDKARGTLESATITGVVTYPLPDRTMAFVQDDTAGVLVLYTNADAEAVSGYSVKVVGRIGAGLLSPI